MKNTCFVIALIASTFIFTSSLIAKVLPVNDEVELLDNLMTQDNELNNLPAILAGNIIENSFSYVDCFTNKCIDSGNDQKCIAYLSLVFVSKLPGSIAFNNIKDTAKLVSIYKGVSELSLEHSPYRITNASILGILTASSILHLQVNIIAN